MKIDVTAIKFGIFKLFYDYIFEKKQAEHQALPSVPTQKAQSRLYRYTATEGREDVIVKVCTDFYFCCITWQKNVVDRKRLSDFMIIYQIKKVCDD